MKILCVDAYGESALDWLLRCVESGHQVKWFFAESSRNKYIGCGLIERVKDWRPWMLWADLVFVPDNVKYVRELDAWRARGVPILGCNAAGAAWELDRDEGMRVLDRAGVECPASVEFTDYDKAIAYVKKEKRRFVSKPSGVEGDKSLSYVSKGPGDMIGMLERWQKLGKLKGAFILQDFIPGIEFAVGGWFGPGGFIEGWEENFEEKPLMSGGIGPGTGEQGTVIRFVKKSKLAKQMLEPLADELERIGYVGCVDVNCIVDDKGQAWPLEHTMRPGWPSFNITMALLKGDPAAWMVDLLEGRDPHCFDLDKIAVGVVVSLPDYPGDRRPIEEVIDFALYGVTQDNVDNIHPCMMMAGEAWGVMGDKLIKRPCLVSAGTYVLVGTGTGDTVSAAKRAAYKVVKDIHMPGSPQYRDDIGERVRKALPDLQKHGFAEDMAW